MAINTIPTQERVIHVRFEGNSQDVNFRTLDVNGSSNDEDMREALARYLDVPVQRLSSYIVERHATGNATLRPEAIFG